MAIPIDIFAVDTVRISFKSNLKEIHTLVLLPRRQEFLHKEKEEENCNCTLYCNIVKDRLSCFVSELNFL